MLKILTLTIALMACTAQATTLQYGPIYLDSVGTIGPSAFGHQAGNMEIKIKNGLPSDFAIACDRNYVTTKNTIPNFNQIFTILLAAQTAGKPVILGLTDDPALTAFGGRCSIVAISIVN